MAELPVLPVLPAHAVTDTHSHTRPHTRPPQVNSAAKKDSVLLGRSEGPQIVAGSGIVPLPVDATFRVHLADPAGQGEIRI